MAEEIKTEEVKPAEEKSEESIESSLSRAEAVAKQLADSNARAAELLKRQEDLIAKAMLTGKSFAGQEPPKPKIETAKEYADKVLAGQVKK